MTLSGRRKIISEFNSNDIRNENNLKLALSTAYRTHILNRSEINYLVDYKNGIQTILDKEKEVRPEINNQIVINHAQMVTRAITGYFLGTPIQYVDLDGSKKDEVAYLNKVVAYEDKASVDKDIAEYQSICGTAYRIIYTDGIYGDAVPFEDKMLEPENTFVVYENNVAEKPLMGVNYLGLFNNTGEQIGYKIYCYTEFGVYTIYSKDFTFGEEDDFEFESFSPYSIGGVPIVEYPNNIWRLGDWELMIGVMDALNTLESGRMDDIEQLVQSLVVFVNADINAEVYDQMRASGVISLVNKGDGRVEVQTISNQLDQTGVAMFAEELKDYIYALIGIPSRNDSASGGGDTGQAVELRDGWADLEIVARNKELTFKRSEKMALKIMLNIMGTRSDNKLSLLDVDIKFSRNKTNNLLVKTQSYANLIATKTLHPADCLAIVDLVSHVNDYISRGEEFWQEQFGGKEPVVTQQTGDALTE